MNGDLALNTVTTPSKDYQPVASDIWDRDRREVQEQNTPLPSEREVVVASCRVDISAVGNWEEMGQVREHLLSTSPGTR